MFIYTNATATLAAPSELETPLHPDSSDLANALSEQVDSIRKPILPLSPQPNRVHSVSNTQGIADSSGVDTRAINRRCE